MTTLPNIISNYYLKQDFKQDKNICEVFSSQFMRFIAQKIGEDPDIIANVSYVTRNSAEGKQIYIGSKIFNGYRDLFLDAYLAYQLPAYQNLRQVAGRKINTLPHKRPGYLKHDFCTDTIIEAGRYTALTPGLALRAIVDDPDSHFKNIGAIPIVSSSDEELIPLYENNGYSGYCVQKAKPIDHLGKVTTIKIKGINYYQIRIAREPDIEEYKEALIKHNNHYYLIPNINNTHAVQIDFGGALGDFRLPSRRTLDGKIHIKALHNLFRYYPSYEGPPAYQNQISTALTSGATYFFETLARFAMIDKNEIASFINKEIDKAFLTYEDKPEVLLHFAQRIGLNASQKELANLNLLGNRIKQFLQLNFTNRQEHAKLLFLDHFCKLDYSTQRNLMDSYSQAIEPQEKLKDKLIRQFFYHLKQENLLLFDTLKAIDNLHLNIVYDPDSSIYLEKIKVRLNRQVCRAFLKNKLEETAKEVNPIIKKTDNLLKEFVNTKSKLSKIPLSNLYEASKHIVNFINIANQYKEDCIATSTKQDIIIAACTLSGALTGAILGAAVGLFLGGLIFGPLTMAAGTTQGLIIGTAIGSAIISLLAGGSTANKLTRYHLFKSIDEHTKNLSDSLALSTYDLGKPQLA
ncbi:hypothetical protein ACNVED_05060 [Legionella sp. D16C41]|uniref:hypothetical protein n=1 Tax=Legionella sp. D16C41 TaxID=3402688 RepID=UPI003AF8358E